tara:strand:- start:587 stop:751 length:165 start_codon:yes stop_codon:yes gene_type:complete
MSNGQMLKVDIQSRIIKLKNELYGGNYSHKNGDWHDGAHSMLNNMLEILKEYRY